MNPLHSEIVSATLVQRGAAIRRITRTHRGATSSPIATIADLHADDHDDPTQPKAPTPAGNTRAKLIVTLPAELCVVRPIALDAAGFAAARHELLRSADEMFPFQADDVMLGYIARAPDTTEDNKPGANPNATGWLVAAPRSRATPLIEQVARRTGLTPHTVLAPHQAMLGLTDLTKNDRDARIEETSPIGTRALHRLRRGLPAALAEIDRSETDTPAFHLPTRLPEHQQQAHRLADAAAVATDAAREHIKPLDGRTPRNAARFAPPALATLAAAAIAAGALWVNDLRHERAADALAAQQARNADTASRVRADLAELRTLASQLQRVADTRSGLPGPTLPTVAQAIEALPDAAYLDTIAVRPGSVTIRGAADRAQAVLRAVEASPAFTSATQNASYARLAIGPERVADYETFDLTAERTTTEPDTPGAQQ